MQAKSKYLIRVLIGLAGLGFGVYGIYTLWPFPLDPGQLYYYKGLGLLSEYSALVMLGSYLVAAPPPPNVFKNNREYNQGEQQTKDKLSDSPTEGSGLYKLRQSWGDGVLRFLSGRQELDENQVRELEQKLIGADFGARATLELIEYLDKTNKDGGDLVARVRTYLETNLAAISQPYPTWSGGGVEVMMLVGVNGAGKTTTAAKLAAHFQAQGRKVILAAADTFRAAAIEQLSEWGERLNIPVIAQDHGADSAAVAYDAVAAAQARGADLVIIDTAGRLHTHSNLMAELEKIGKVIAKLVPAAPHQVLLILDGNTGQNALVQAEEFTKHVAVSGLVVTKLDGTAKGGFIFGLAKHISKPLYFIGVGEQPADLQLFDSKRFADQVLGE